MARGMMAESIPSLAKTNREIYYKLYKSGDVRKGKLLTLELAVFSGNLRLSDTKSKFMFYTPKGAIPSTALGQDAWIETGVKMTINPKKNDVHIDALNRDTSVPSLRVQEGAPKSSTTRVMACLGLAMATEMVIYFGMSLHETTLSLQAADKGTGELLRFYTESFGLQNKYKDSVRTGHSVGPNFVRMEGTLSKALENCQTVWENRKRMCVDDLPHQFRMALENMR